MVTHKHKLQEILMPTWVVQRDEELAMRDEQDISNSNKPLFVNCFDNKNYFVAALYEGCIVEVVQDTNEQDNDNDNDNSKINKDPDNPPGISLETTVSCGGIEIMPP